MEKDSINDTNGIKGRFEGNVKTEWLIESGSDRGMLLLDDFSFIDPLGKKWVASAGSIINGASIPRILWTICGSPYTGDYRRASVLHDVACSERKEHARDVHRMFYDAMICDGMDENLALQFYTAVRLFGPDWKDDEYININSANLEKMESALDEAKIIIYG